MINRKDNEKPEPSVSEPIPMEIDEFPAQKKEAEK
jgi:hypothetical protein